MVSTNLDPNLLEERLAGDYQTARKRVGEFHERVGIAEPKGSVAERQLAKGFRIKGQLYGQAELAEIDLNLKNLVDDLATQTEFTTLQDQEEYKITQAKAFNAFREDLMRKGIMMQEQIYSAKLDAKTKIAMQENFSELAYGAAFTFALKGMNQTQQPQMLQATGGPAGDGGTFIAPSSQGVPTTNVYA